MQISSLSEIKKEIKILDPNDLENMLLRLAKHSKENKELLHYLLFEADYESNFIDKIKEDISLMYQELSPISQRNTKKGMQKVLRHIKKQCKFSGKKTTEIELLCHFCRTHINCRNPFKWAPMIHNLFQRQIIAIEKAIESLEPDLQADYNEDIELFMQYFHLKLNFN